MDYVDGFGGCGVDDCRSGRGGVGIAADTADDEEEGD